MVGVGSRPEQKRCAAARIRTGVVAATTRSTDLYTTAAHTIFAVGSIGYLKLAPLKRSEMPPPVERAEGASARARLAKNPQRAERERAREAVDGRVLHW